MKKLLIAILFVSIYASAQETEFTFTAEKGMTDFVVTPAEGKTAPEIYKKVIEWIKVTYKNPDKVILSTIENEYLRFEGSEETLYSYFAMGKRNYLTSKYQIEVNFKDGRYKFNIIGFQLLAKNTWVEQGIFNSPKSKEELQKGVFNEDGTLKKYTKNIMEVPTYFNTLNKSLKDYISSNEKNNDGWFMGKFKNQDGLRKPSG